MTEPLVGVRHADPQHWLHVLQTRLHATLQDVPGWQVAVSTGATTLDVAHGLADVAAGRPVTSRTRFRVASVTKVLTAGALLDTLPAGSDRVVDLLGDGPWPHWEPITVAHLLHHRSGLVGDYFPPTGEGADAVRRYVDALARQPLLHPAGMDFSYSNAGFVLAGRLLEILTGLPWDEATTSWAHALGHPVRLTVAPDDPDVAQTYRRTPAMPDPLWPRERGAGPAGSTTALSARDLAEVVGAALRHGGHGRSGATYPLPHETFGSGVCAGWFVDEHRLGQVLSHAGGSATLVLAVPEQDVTLAFLGNAPGATPAFRAAADDLLVELVGERSAPTPVTPARRRLPTAGTYVHAGRSLTIEGRGGTHVLHDGDRVRPLVRLDDTAWAPADDHGAPLTAHGTPGGPDYVQWQLRLFARTEDPRA